MIGLDILATALVVLTYPFIYVGLGWSGIGKENMFIIPVYAVIIGAMNGLESL